MKGTMPQKLSVYSRRNTSNKTHRSYRLQQELKEFESWQKRSEQLALLEDVRTRITRELNMVELEKIQLEEELAALDGEITEVKQWN
jgi:hypothetical protein